jgi:hypothetical protein
MAYRFIYCILLFCSLLGAYDGCKSGSPLISCIEFDRSLSIYLSGLSTQSGESCDAKWLKFVIAWHHANLTREGDFDTVVSGLEKEIFNRDFTWDSIEEGEDVAANADNSTSRYQSRRSSISGKYPIDSLEIIEDEDSDSDFEVDAKISMPPISVRNILLEDDDDYAGEEEVANNTSLVVPPESMNQVPVNTKPVEAIAVLKASTMLSSPTKKPTGTNSLRRLFSRFSFKGFGLALEKSTMQWNSIGLGFRLPITPNFPEYDKNVALPRVGLFVGCFYPNDYKLTVAASFTVGTVVLGNLLCNSLPVTLLL